MNYCAPSFFHWKLLNIPISYTISTDSICNFRSTKAPSNNQLKVVIAIVCNEPEPALSRHTYKSSKTKQPKLVTTSLPWHLRHLALEWKCIDFILPLVWMKHAWCVLVLSACAFSLSCRLSPSLLFPLQWSYGRYCWFTGFGANTHLILIGNRTPGQYLPVCCHI